MPKETISNSQFKIIKFLAHNKFLNSKQNKNKCLSEITTQLNATKKRIIFNLSFISNKKYSMNKKLKNSSVNKTNKTLKGLFFKLNSVLKGMEII